MTHNSTHCNKCSTNHLAIPVGPGLATAKQWLWSMDLLPHTWGKNTNLHNLTAWITQEKRWLSLPEHGPTPSIGWKWVMNTTSVLLHPVDDVYIHLKVGTCIHLLFNRIVVSTNGYNGYHMQKLSPFLQGFWVVTHVSCCHLGLLKVLVTAVRLWSQSFTSACLIKFSAWALILLI